MKSEEKSEEKILLKFLKLKFYHSVWILFSEVLKKFVLAKVSKRFKKGQKYFKI